MRNYNDKGFVFSNKQSATPPLARKETVKMLELKIIPPPTIELFENYHDLFYHLVRLENLKMLAPNPDFSTMNWSFTLYSPDRVALLFEHMKEDFLPIKEAYDQGLPLLEICSGDFGLPEYIVKTPMLNMDYLKKRWVLDYCESHGITCRDNCT